MSKAVAAQLAALEAMTGTALQIEWRRHYGTEPPKIGVRLMRMGIAYRIQEQAYGKLSRSLQARLRRIAKGESYGDRPVGAMRPGTRLVRRWNGKTIIVTVTDSGFLYGDTEYRSLSQIACAVTGSHWSGPRFFGLTRATPRGK